MKSEQIKRKARAQKLESKIATKESENKNKCDSKKRRASKENVTEYVKKC